MRCSVVIPVLVLGKYRAIMALVVVISMLLFQQNAEAGAVDVTLGLAQICVLHDNGGLDCRTAHWAARLVPPPDAPPLTQISSGDVHTCGLTMEGGIYCFGDNDFGQLDAPDDRRTYVQIDAAANYTCALDDIGQVTCWGLSDNGPVVPQLAEDIQTVLQVDASRDQTCILGVLTDNSRRITCWSGDDALYDLEADDVNHIQSRQDRLCMSDPAEVRCYRYNAWTDSVRLDSVFRSPGSDGAYTSLAYVGGSGNILCALDQGGQLFCDFSRASDHEKDAFVSAYQDLQTNRYTLLRTDERAIGLCAIDLLGREHCLHPLLLEPEYLLWSNPEEQWRYHLPSTLQQAKVYSDSTLELFWKNPGTSWPLISAVQVYRDDELVATIDSAESYLDTGIQPRREYRYKIRLVLVDGSVGDFSNELLVSTHSREIVPETDIDPAACAGIPLPSPGALEIRHYGPGRGELFWKPDQYDPELLTAFAVFVNGRKINENPVYANGSFWLGGEDLQPGNRLHIVAIDKCGRTSPESETVVTDQVIEGTSDVPMCDMPMPEKPDLAVLRYGDSIAELFWSADIPARYPVGEYRTVEIQRRSAHQTGSFLSGGYGSFLLMASNVAGGDQFVVRYLDECGRWSDWSDPVTMPVQASSQGLAAEDADPPDVCEPFELPTPELDILYIRPSRTDELNFGWNHADYSSSLLSYALLYRNGEVVGVWSSLFTGASGNRDLEPWFLYVDHNGISSDDRFTIRVGD